MTADNSDSKQFAVIFDLDGVLVDTSEFHKQSWFDLARKEGFEITDEFFYATFGMQNYQILPILARRSLTQNEIDQLAEWKEARYRRLLEGKLTLMPGVLALLRDIKGHRFLLAIGTSTPKANLDFMLLCMHVGGLFDAYVTGEDVKHGKPAPDTFLKAAEKLALPPSCCVVVEDAIPGVEAAKNARMPVVAVTTTRTRAELHRADRIVDSLAELNAQDFINLIENQSP
ncbi:MAG: HAD family hydrolase [Planctomycetota bacterium]|jgi:beta-phosphoglucomutase family hydrolase